MKEKIDAIMEDMLKRAKEIDQEGLCLGLFTIQEILEKHFQDTTDDVERICPHCGYATIPLKVNKPSEPYGKSLKDTTEEKPTVATVLAYEQGYKEALSEVASILKKEKCVGVPYMNGIERGIEVAEELLANSV